LVLQPVGGLERGGEEDIDFIYESGRGKWRSKLLGE
jgi:hypothetical protein